MWKVIYSVAFRPDAQLLLLALPSFYCKKQVITVCYLSALHHLQHSRPWSSFTADHFFFTLLIWDNETAYGVWDVGFLCVNIFIIVLPLSPFPDHLHHMKPTKAKSLVKLKSDLTGLSTAKVFSTVMVSEHTTDGSWWAALSKPTPGKKFICYCSDKSTKHWTWRRKANPLHQDNGSTGQTLHPKADAAL